VDNSKTSRRLSQIGKLLRTLKLHSIPFHILHKHDSLPALQKVVKGLVISGSPIKVSEKNNVTDMHLNLLALSSFDVPTLGICFGCQLLHIIHGCKVRNVGQYNCLALDTSLDTNHALFQGNIAALQPCFYCFSDLPIVPSSHNPNAKTIANFQLNGTSQPCAFEYPNHKYGVLFHPESKSSTHHIIKNFASICGM